MSLGAGGVVAEAQPLDITPLTHVSKVVTHSPGMAAVFQRLGIDFCCGGHRPIQDICADKGLDGTTMAAMLNALRGGRISEAERVDGYSAAQLVAHIVDAHHSYVRSEAPRLQAMADKVARVHADKDARVRDVAATLRDMLEELGQHMEREEKVVFPAILEAARVGAKLSDKRALRELHDEHVSAGQALQTIRQLTDGYTPGEWACGTVRSLWHDLAEFEADLFNHVHKENNILFPMVLPEGVHVAM